MLIEIVLFAGVFALLMLKMENKSEWLYNIKHHRKRNWTKKWHGIPTTKLVFILFLVIIISAVLFTFFSFSINYLVWDFFFLLHFGLFILAGASLYLFVWCLGGRAMRVGSNVGKLTQVEGTEPKEKTAAEKKTFADGMFQALFDNLFGESKRKRRKKER